MIAIPSTVDTTAPEFKRRQKKLRALLDKLDTHLQAVRLGGGKAALERHLSRGKRSARDRIEAILDPGSPFLELSPLAAHGLYGDQAPGAGIVTGIGRVHGRECLFVANDATVKGGAYFPMTAKKHLRAQQIAMDNRLPCLYLVDSGGAYLPLQDEVFPDREHFGRIFYNQARMSAAGIPQIAIVLGSCTAGGAYVPAMADETVLVEGNGKIFLAGPPLVAAATGEKVEAEELGGAEVHCRHSGLADHRARDEEHALALARDIVENLGKRETRPAMNSDADEPLYPASDIEGLLPEDTTRTPFEVREIIARLLDGSRFHEFKRDYGPTLVCGTGALYGISVGIVANNGVLFSDSALKGAHFIELCAQRGTPLLFLQNITGFMVGRKAEMEGIAKHGAKMVTAVTGAAVPKITLIIGGSYGAGNYGMCGRAYDPRFLFMWPSARIAIMGGEQAAEVLAGIKEQSLRAKGATMKAAERNALLLKIRREYAERSSALYSTARLWDDGIIRPDQTRQVLGLALGSCSQGGTSSFGVFRM